MRRGALWARQTDVRSPTPDTASLGLTLVFVCAAYCSPGSGELHSYELGLALAWVCEATPYSVVVASRELLWKHHNFSACSGL